MITDRWFLIVEDELDDIPARINQLKSWYSLRIILFLIMIGAGLLTMSFADDMSLIAIGGLAAVTGITGMMTISVIAHTQLCLYRTLIEMRQLGNKHLS